VTLGEQRPLQEGEESVPGWDDAHLTEPVGEGARTVRAGECLASIAVEQGFFWETLWNHPDNAELRERRGDPYILRTGDRVTVPERVPRLESALTDRRHVFRRRGVPEKLRVQLLDEERKPRAALGYEVHIRGQVQSGESDGEGWIEAWIDPKVRRAAIVIDEDERYDVGVGRLEPVATVAGAAARLAVLSYIGWHEQDMDARALSRALITFQTLNALEATGALDEATQQKLLELHGS
jgi:hypothetical protein